MKQPHNDREEEPGPGERDAGGAAAGARHHAALPQAAGHEPRPRVAAGRDAEPAGVAAAEPPHPHLQQTLLPRLASQRSQQSSQAIGDYMITHTNLDYSLSE